MNKLFHMKQISIRMIRLSRSLLTHIRAARAERLVNAARRADEKKHIEQEHRKKQEKSEALLRLEHITIRANVFATTRTTARRAHRGWN